MEQMDWPPNREAVIRLVSEALCSDNWWAYRGERVNSLEKRFAESHGCEHGVSVANAAIGLDVILEALGVGPGDEVILPAYDFFSLPKSVINVGARPVFVDVHPYNPTIDAGKVAAVLTPRTKAVVAVHISGALAKVDELSRVCRDAGVFLVEDCAQATGAIYADRRVGGWGDAGVFSFGGVKLMTSGQGGMITTSSRETYEKCYALCNRGMLPDQTVNPYGIIGQNLHLSEIAACILLPQLDVLDEYCQRREAVMRYLDEQIIQIPGLRPVEQFPGTSVRTRCHMPFSPARPNWECLLQGSSSWATR